MDWEKWFSDLKVFWFHDENPQRPFARLTSNLISDGFFNGDRLAKSPHHLDQAVGHLMHDARLEYAFVRTCGPRKIARHAHGRRSTMADAPEPIQVEEQVRPRLQRVVGVAHGATLLAASVARHAGAEVAIAIYPTYERDGHTLVDKTRVSLERYAEDFGERDVCCIVEDTITTGDTVRKARDEILRIAPGTRLLPCVLCMCNRSGETHVDGLEIISLISPRIRKWKEGENPYTPDGKERVPPLRPKGLNWKILNAKY